MHVGVETGNPVIAFSGEIDLASAEGFTDCATAMGGGGRTGHGGSVEGDLHG